MSDESEAPEFAWQQFHDVAARLLDHGDEASLRSAVSRDYYAVFHRAQAVLSTLDPHGSPARGVGSHEDVWSRLDTQLKGRQGMLTKHGRSLLVQRKKADYRHPITDWPNLARRVHEQARQALALADELEPG